MCLAQGPQHTDASEARTRGPLSLVKHSTTEPLPSRGGTFPFTNVIGFRDQTVQ